MTKLIDIVPRDDSLLPYATLKVTERLAAFNHRNLALLNGVGLVQHVFDKLYGDHESPKMGDAEQSVLQRLLRRLLEMGASTSEARTIFHGALTEEFKIDSEILEVLRSAKRAKWPEHFSFDGSSGIRLVEDGGRMLPCPTGLTYMVCSSFSERVMY